MYDNSIVLTDLLGIAHLQLLQDNFSKLTGLYTELIDPDGLPLTTASNQTTIYRMLLQTDEGRQQREQVLYELCVANRRTRETATRRSQGLGLVGAVPIFLGRVHLGSWIVGPVLQSEDDREKLQQWAMITGLAEELVAREVKEPELVTAQRFSDIMVFIEALTGTVIRLAQASYDMMQSNRSLTELTEQLSSTAQMLAKFTNSADVGMYVTDFFTGEILQSNDRHARFLGVTVEELVGTQCWLSQNREWESFCPDCPHDQLLDDKGYPGKPVVWERHIPDEDIWYQLTNQAIYWVDGRLAQMVTMADITQTKRMQNQLAHLAYYDRAMQLPNALRLLADLQEWREEDTCQLICFDIQSLRVINDVYSRQTGDDLLRAIAEWAQQAGGQDACLYRVDGDEFCLLLKNQLREDVQSLAERIFARFEEPWGFPINQQMLHIFCSISMGVLYFDGSSEASGEDILSLFERVLSNARQSGKVTVYDETMDREHKQRLKLEMSLQACVKEGMQGFEVFYQPIVDPVRGTWCSLEALCRWNSPDCGQIAPLEFIHEAEQMGLIGIVGTWVLETAVRQCKEWGLDKLDKFLLDVNLSPAQMTDENLVGLVMEILERYDFPGEKLSLEITESTELNFSHHTMQAIERLRAANVQVALDDFGTGYSSFNNLKQLPVSILKTERAFLENIENDDYLQYLFYLMVELAHTAGMKIIAEGVENEEQMRILLRNGVDLLQGYFFSRPLSAEELSGKLENFSKVSELFYDLRSDRIDMQKLLDKGYTITPSMYQLLGSCMQILFSTPDTDEAVLRVLQLVGENFGVSRAVVFLNQGDDTFINTHEWTAAGVAPVRTYNDVLVFPDHCPSWIPMLRERGVILAMDVAMLPEDMHSFISRQHVKAVAVIPIWRESFMQGFVGFDDCESYRDWLPEEILMLYNLCLLLANILDKQGIQQEYVKQNRVLSNVLDSMDTSLYISDLKDYRILYANNRVKDRHGWVEGQLCYKALHGRNEPCSFCHRDWLAQNPKEPGVAWEYCDERDERHYRVFDSIIAWKRERPAYMQYAVDISAIKEYQQQLEVLVSQDVFTGTLNRHALLMRLEELLEDVHKQGATLAVCFVDVDALKYINDHFGHRQGDTVLLETVRALKSCMGERDVLGRYGGDEFVLLLWNQGPNEAHTRLEQALEILRTRSAKEECIWQFSSGVAGTWELPRDEKATAERLLELADTRMLQNKRTRKNTREHGSTTSAIAKHT